MSTSNKKPIGHRIVHLDSIDSTNNYAAKLLSQSDVPHGTVIMADEQTSGRGQRGNSWQSNPGENILLTIVLRPDNLSIANQFYLTQFASIALHDFLSTMNLNAAIKWPNDLYVDDKKIAGMLIENHIVRDKIAISLLGIGVNVNQLHFNDLQATSLQLQTKRHYTVSETAEQLIERLEHTWQLLNIQAFEKLRETYKENLYLKGISSSFSTNEETFMGTILGTTQEGFLVIRMENQEIRTFDLKELRFTPRNIL